VAIVAEQQRISKNQLSLNKNVAEENYNNKTLVADTAN